MDKRERAQTFRERLREAMVSTGVSKSELAARIGVDRSTISQLLAAPEPRLPNGQVVAELGASLKVSADWLLGLTTRAEQAADILEGSLQIAGSERRPVDKHLLAWHREATGYKIRHVPATLPDLLKTENVLRYEYREHTTKTSDEAIADTQGKLAYLRLPEADMEICMAAQDLQAFARGEGVWEALPKTDRYDQLVHMGALIRRFYPGLRLYLFDQRNHTSAPYTVFGPLRVAIYVGQCYFAFNTTKHVRALTQHFDELVRAAVVQADEVGDWLEAQSQGLR